MTVENRHARHELIKSYKVTLEGDEFLDANKRAGEVNGELSDQERADLARGATRLAFSKALKHFNRFGGSFGDKLGAANLAIVVSAIRFDKHEGVNFTSYAGRAVENALVHEDHRSCGPLSGSSSTIMKARKMRKVADRLWIENAGRYPSLEEISEESGLSVETIENYFLLLNTPVKIENGPDSRLQIDDFSTSNPESLMVEKEAYNSLDSALKALEEEERDLLYRYFGLGDVQSMSQAQIGRILGLTRAAISLRIKKVISKLEEAMKSEDYPSLGGAD